MLFLKQTGSRPMVVAVRQAPNSYTDTLPPITITGSAWRATVVASAAARGLVERPGETGLTASWITIGPLGVITFGAETSGFNALDASIGWSHIAAWFASPLAKPAESACIGIRSPYRAKQQQNKSRTQLVSTQHRPNSSLLDI